MGDWLVGDPKVAGFPFRLVFRGPQSGRVPFRLVFRGPQNWLLGDPKVKRGFNFLVVVVVFVDV